MSKVAVHLDPRLARPCINGSFMILGAPFFLTKSVVNERLKLAHEPWILVISFRHGN